MQTVNFRCGHCNNLMAVSTEFLGQQVRCPHCQNVVVAPPAAPGPGPVRPASPAPTVPAGSTAPGPAPSTSNADAPAGPDAQGPAPHLTLQENPFEVHNESEDIFSEKEASDSLFDEPQASLLEVPPLSTAPDAAPAADAPSIPLEQPPADPAALAAFQEAVNPSTIPTHAYDGEAVPPAAAYSHEPVLPTDSAFASGSALVPGPSFLHDHVALPAESSVSVPWSAQPTDNGQATAHESQQTPSTMASARKPRGSGKINWFIPLVFIPLLLYAVLSTAAAVYLYLNMKASRPSMFDQMPDVEGDTPGVRPNRQKVSLKIDRALATMPLPDHLHVALGETLTVGDIEVTPTRLERTHVNLFAEGSDEKAEPSPYQALVLHLKLKNRAENYAFTPLDNYFDRKWQASVTGKPPLTMLVAGEQIFFGGPARWAPLSQKRTGARREWLKGRKDVDREGLAPGESMETYVCTDGWDSEIPYYLFGVDKEGAATGRPYSGKLLWRVQMRRGLVPYKGRQLPATAVIGVDFNSADIPRKVS